MFSGLDDPLRHRGESGSQADELIGYIKFDLSNLLSVYLSPYPMIGGGTFPAIQIQM